MGGSWVAGKIFSEVYSGKPVSLVDSYELPEFVSKSTLVIAISYSGNTEETVGLAKQAAQKKAHVVTISSGGMLPEYGNQKIIIPRSDLQPRSATGYMIMPILYGFGLAKEEDVRHARTALEALDKDNAQCLGHAKTIAHRELIPVIYGSSPFKSMAYRWKTQFNENSKIMAYSNYFPELNHNDTLPLAQTYRKDGFYFFVFGSDNPKISKRISVTAEITKTKFNMIEPKGSSYLERMFYMLHYGDYVSYHLGLLRNVDPADVSLIGAMKKALS
jgi:glucose/mannose-6-phosphate isomerase